MKLFCDDQLHSFLSIVSDDLCMAAFLQLTVCLSLLICTLQLQPSRSDQADSHLLLPTLEAHLKDLFNDPSFKTRDQSMKFIAPKARSQNCTRACSFQMSFDDLYRRPANCSARTLAFQCVAQVALLYHTRQILVVFRTVGQEEDEPGYILYALQQFFYAFNFNYTGLALTFTCFYGDDCDWTYIGSVISKFINLNIEPLNRAFQALLYNPSSLSTPIQCFTQNGANNCSIDRCIASVNEDTLSYNRSCGLSTNSNIGIDIRRRRIYPVPPVGNTNTHGFICNRNLCNDPSTTDSLRQIIRNYSEATELPKPSMGMPLLIRWDAFLMTSLLFFLFM